MIEDGSTEVLRFQREGDHANSASAIWRLCGKSRRSNDGRGREVKSKDESRNDYDTRRGHKHTSEYRGVSWNKRDSKWQAYIHHSGEKHYLGYFDDEEEAARAYDRAARANQGDKAMLNFPAEGEQGVNDGKRSKYRGVYWVKSSSKWRVKIHHTGKNQHLGSFDDEEEAAMAYDRGARTHHGDKAMLNFPAEGEQGMSVGVTSEYRGVCWQKKSNTGKQQNIGYFDDEKEAARAYDRAAREHHGNKTILNFPAEGEEGEGIGQAPRKKRSGKCQVSIRHTGKRRNLGNYGYSFDDDEETARTYDRATKAHHFHRVAPDFVAEGVDEQRVQELAAVAPLRTHSWSGMYPSVITALGFRLQVDMPREIGVVAEAKETSAAEDRSRGGERAKLSLGVMVAEAGDDTTWACESILRKRHATGEVEYEVGEHYRQRGHPIYRTIYRYII
jgi:hypothetical protein